MKRAIACLALCLVAPAFAWAGPQATSSIVVEEPWLRATPKGAPVIGGYATITNKGSTPDRLVGASIPMAANAEVHSMTMEGGVMHMERLKGGLAIAPGATVTLAPGGDHLMFTKPTAQIRQGQEIAGTMLFEKAGARPVTFAVGGIGALGAPNSHSMPGMKMQ